MEVAEVEGVSLQEVEAEVVGYREVVVVNFQEVEVVEAVVILQSMAGVVIYLLHS